MRPWHGLALIGLRLERQWPCGEICAVVFVFVIHHFVKIFGRKACISSKVFRKMHSPAIKQFRVVRVVQEALQRHFSILKLMGSQVNAGATTTRYRFSTRVTENNLLENVTLTVSNEDLDEMFDKRLYNTVFWPAVIARQKEKCKKAYQSVSAVQACSGCEVSVVARAILESSGKWEGELGKNDQDSSAAAAEQRHNIQYPFTVVKFMETRQEKEVGVNSSVEHRSTTEIVKKFEALNAVDAVALNELSNVDEIRQLYPHQIKSGTKIIENEEAQRWRILYGTPNPNISNTQIPCGGCGALLHCQDPAIPGYLPSEVLEGMSKMELQNTTCQRCSFLKEYNVALKVSVTPEDYIKAISEIQTKKALIILMVDLLDFPCSIWPGIIDLIGPKRPVIVVGNKVDLLPKDSNGYLERIKTSLLQSLKDFGIHQGNNVKRICLISSKTGYGVEELITAIHNSWGAQGDVYLVGCTNVGKSSLFNALLQSDLCKVQAVDLIQRATISLWPGTTLNLLKFPILRPTPWRLYLRTKRLKAASSEASQERILRAQKLKETRDPVYATVIGHIGMTFKTDVIQESMAFSKDPFKLSLSMETDLPLRRKKLFKETDPEFASGKWFYDTPGALHYDQILSLLTLEELSLTIPKSLIRPRCFIMKPGETFFLAGLGRMDYLEGGSSLILMLFSSPELPVSIVKTQLADEFYQKYLGTDVLKVPHGNERRLKDFPVLQPKEFTFTGMGQKECCGDIVLSSAGWVSISLNTGLKARLLAYTPEGRGCHLRQPALLKYAVELRGERIRRTPFCRPSKLVE